VRWAIGLSHCVPSACGGHRVERWQQAQGDDLESFEGHRVEARATKYSPIFRPDISKALISLGCRFPPGAEKLGPFLGCLMGWVLRPL
jgi:hypothetical protein